MQEQQWSVPGYTAVKRLGSGGFGDVVLAAHDASGTQVAIKYLHRELLDDAEFAAMFRDEATVLASLEDANVVRLYEYVESPEGAAIVMELIDGVALREILHNQGKTTPEAALVVLEGSLLGLAAAHRRGVVHRDYKPENVLVDGMGISKLTDFGIAARAGDSPFPAGTLAYAPPEQMAGGPASPQGDVYSATATFYECVTGQLPFDGRTADQLLHQHRIKPVPMEPVPVPLRPLVAAGMAKDPWDRPTDGTTLVVELDAIASGAYGRDWRERGRSHLGEAALLLAALWPSDTPPAVQGTLIHRIWLNRQFKVPGSGAVKAAAGAGILLAIVAASTAVAATGSSFRSTASNHPSPVHSVSLQPVATLLPPPPAPSPSPSSSPSPAPPAPGAFTTLPPPPLPAPTPTPTPTPAPSKKPSPSPSPTKKSPSPTPTPTPTPTKKPSPTPTPTPTPTRSTPPPSPTPSPSPSSSPPIG